MTRDREDVSATAPPAGGSADPASGGPEGDPRGPSGGSAPAGGGAADRSGRVPRGPTSWPVYLLLSVLSYVASVLPGPIAYGLGSLLGACLFGVTLWREPRANRRRRGALRNMRIAFGPDVTRRELTALTWRYTQHVALVLVETLRLPLLTKRRLAGWVDAREVAPILELARAGQGVVCAAGHFGNWELMLHVAGLLGLPITSLARPCAEPGLERWLQRNRRRSGGHVVSKYGGLSPLVRTLQRGGVAGLNVDENARGGVFVAFCGVQAATNPSAFLLARRARVPVAVVTCQRVAPERFKLHVWALVPPVPRSPRRARLDSARGQEKAALTATIAGAFERALAAYPEQWLWSLRRWESRPPGEEAGSDGLPPRVGPPLPLAGSRPFTWVPASDLNNQAALATKGTGSINREQQ